MVGLAAARCTWRFAPLALLLVVLAISVPAFVRQAHVAGDQEAVSLLVDDAFYYIVPARSLLAGRGYTFDGEVRTNGVQPLWALLSVGFVAVGDRIGVVPRMLVLGSALCWMGAAVLLYVTLGRWDAWAGLLAATGFIATAFAGHVAFQGMENGLHALTFSAVLWYGMRNLGGRPDAAWTSGALRRFYLTLGLLLALVTLARVDSGLLALTVGLSVLVGLTRPDAPPRLRLCVVPAFWLALPGTLLVGAWLVFSHAYFGSAWPISGLVKMHYQGSAPPAHGGVWGLLLWHLRFLSDWTLDPVTLYLVPRLEKTCRLAWAFEGVRWVLRIVLGLGALCLAGRGLRRLRWHGAPAAAAIFAAVVVLFVLAHFCAYALRFSLFTRYGTWYFAPEMLCLWALYAGSLMALLPARPRAESQPQSRRWLLARALVGGGAAIGVLMLNLEPMQQARAAPEYPSSFCHTGRWLERILPPGQRIGAFSSGRLGYLARSQTVINLDGLMNNREYLDDYLRQGRIAEYVRKRGVTYFADYNTSQGWRHGSYWGLDLTRAQLVYWTPLNQELSHGVWRLVSDGEATDPLGPCTHCDRPSQIQYAAEILGRWRVIPDAALAAWQVEARPEAESVITSFPDPATLELRHVVVANSQRRQLALDEQNTTQFRPVDVAFGGVLRLTGVELPMSMARRGGRIIVSLRWTALSAGVATGDPLFELAVKQNIAGQGDPLGERTVDAWHACHETYPVAMWLPGETVIETRSALLPADLPRGQHQLLLNVRDADGHILDAMCAGSEAAAPTFPLGAIGGD